MQEKRNVRTDKRGGRVPGAIIVPVGDDKFRAKAGRPSTAGISANVQSAANIKRQISARTDHPASAIVEENIDVRIGGEVSANFDIDISARADVARRVHCFVIILYVQS